ncbi:MAG: alpha-amylase family glycosyl hydrolase [Luteibaculaceae bacterium]
MTRFYSLLFFAFFGFTLMAQPVTTNPVFVTQDAAPLQINFNGFQGNGAIGNIAPVYMHTGIITNQSATLTDWQFVRGNWGTADPTVLMTPLGGGNHRFIMQNGMQAFYNFPDGVEVLKMCFVFRNANGTVVGRNADGSDICVDVFDPDEFVARITTPSTQPLFVTAGQTITVNGASSQNSDMTLRVNNTQIASVTDATSISGSFNVNTYPQGLNWIYLEADNDSEIVLDSISFIRELPVVTLAPPVPLKEGINYFEDDHTRVAFKILAPFKERIYLIGDFNNWVVDPEYQLFREPNSNHWWIELTDITPGEEYAFQYLIDQTLRVGDGYAEKILDPWNDPWIPAETYPNLKPYPTGQTTGIVSVFQTNRPQYQWDETINYTRPDYRDLVIYELLVRDFTEERNWQSVIDTLGYLVNLGINAVKLMPVMEFEGNESWGYNPMYFFALDKYYGTRDKFKEFIEECHRNGIAVILDIAINHAFGQHPHVQMYFNPNVGDFGRPTPQNPWFNEIERHPFNVGFDYNHEALPVREYTDRVFKYWVEEFKIDGYRMDLSKGFTQNNTLGNVAAWNQFDQSRINIWNFYSSELWDIDPDLYIILEHFANNDEETVLANMGFMLWGNMNTPYSEAVMGFVQNSNLTGGSWQARGWSAPRLITYMESHDEERVMFRAQNFGVIAPNHNVRDLEVGLARFEAATSIFMTVPGPKMMWQFGELGYDFSINYCPDTGLIQEGCRTANKPVRWDYWDVAARQRLYKVYKAMIDLKTQYPIFRTNDFNQDVGGGGKRIRLFSPTANVVTVANFETFPINIVPGFAFTGTWYNYFTGETVNVTDVNATIPLGPGEYRVFLDFQTTTPDLTVGLEEIIGQVKNISHRVFPNPTADQFTLEYFLTEPGQVTIELFNITGERVAVLANGMHAPGEHIIQWSRNKSNAGTLPAGTYIYRIVTNNDFQTGKVMIK